MRFKFFDFKKLLISIFVFCICLVGGGYAGSNFFNAPKEKINEEFSDAETPLMTIPTDGTTPKDHSILDNLQIAASVIKSNPHFKGITTGHAITNMVIQNDQNVYTERRVDGEYSYVNTITSSSFVKSATQKFFNGKSSQKVFMRDGKVNDDNFAESTFDDSKEPRVYERNAFLEIYGWTPYQLCSYIFRDDSVILEESKVIEDSSYFYAAEVKCDLVNSISQSKREVKTNGGAIDYPKYSSVTVTIFLNDKWQVQRMMYHDVYDITVKMGIALTAPVDSSLVEDFYYDKGEYEIDQSIIDYYKQYGDLSSSTNNEPKDKEALDYISESMLGMALGGSTLNVHTKVANVDTNGQIYCKFDIKSKELRLTALFDDFYLAYDKNLLISYKKYNYKLNEEYFNHVIKSLNIDVNALIDKFSSKSSSTTSSSSNSEMDGLMKQLSSLETNKVQEGDIYKVTIKGNLTYKGLDVNFALYMDEDEDGAILTGIDLDALVDGKEIKADVNVNKDKINFENKEYVDLSSTSWFIDEMINVVSFKGYEENLSFNYDIYSCEVNAYYDNKKNALVKANIKSKESNEEIEFNLSYVNDEIYFAFGNNAFKLTRDDLLSLKEMMIEFSKTELKKNQNKEINQNEISKILDTIYNVFDGITGDENNINISLSLSSITSSLKNTVLSLSTENNALIIESKEYNLKSKLSEFISTLDFNLDHTYLGKDELDTCLKAYYLGKDIVTSNKVEVNFNNVKLNINSSCYLMDGKIIKDDSSYELMFNFVDSNDNVYKLDLTRVNKEYYAILNIKGEKYYLSLSEDDIVKLFIDIYEGRGGLIKEENLSLIEKEYIHKYEDIYNQLKKGDYSFIEGDIDIDSTLKNIFDVLSYLKYSHIEVNDNNVIYYDNDYLVKINSLDDNVNFFIKGKYDIYSFNGDLSLSRFNDSVQVKDGTYVNINEVISRVDNLIISLKESNLTIEDLYSYSKSIKEFNGYNINLDYSNEGYLINLNGNINKSLDGEFNISLINEDNERVTIHVTYLDKNFYLNYGNINVVASKDNIKEVISLMGENEISLSSYLTQENLNNALDIISSIEFKDNKLEINVILTKINPSLIDIHADVIFDEVNKTLILTDASNNINLKVNDFDGEINVIDVTYLNKDSLMNLYSMFNKARSILLSSKVLIEINDLDIKLDNSTYKIKGRLIKDFSLYELDLDITLDSLNIELRIIEDDDIYYLDLLYKGSQFKFKLTQEDLIKLFISIYEGRGGLLNEEDLNKLENEYIKKYSSLYASLKNKDYSSFNKSISLKEIFNKVYNSLVYLKSCSIDVNENEFIFKDENNIIKINSSSSLNADLDIKYNNISTLGNINLLRFNDDIELNSKDDYVSLDSLINEIQDCVISLNNSSLTIEDLINDSKDIIIFDGYKINLSFVYEDYLVSIESLINKNKAVNAKIKLSYPSKEDIDLNVIYINNSIYLDYYKIHLNASINDIKDLMTLMNNVSSSKVDENKAIIKALDILDSFVFNDDKLVISLALSKLDPSIQDIKAILGYDKINKSLSLSSKSYSLNMVVTNDDNLVNEPSDTSIYLDRGALNKLITTSNEIVTWAKDQVVINLNDINFKYKNYDLKLNGTLIKNLSNYDLNLNLNYKNKDYKLHLVILDNEYYLDLLINNEKINVKLSQEEFIKLLINIYEGRGGLLNEEDLNKLEKDYLNKFNSLYPSLIKGELPTLDSSFNLLDTLTKVYDGLIYLKDGEISFNNNEFIYSSLHNEFKLDLDNLNIDFNINDFNIVSSGNINIVHEIKDIQLDENIKYVDIDTLINKIDNLVLSLKDSSLTIEDIVSYSKDIASFKGYNVKFNFEYENYLVYINAFINKDSNIDADIKLSYPSKDDINIHLTKIKDDIYLNYENINVNASIDDLKELIGLISTYTKKDITSSSLDINSILEKVITSLTSLEFKDETLVIGVALSKLTSLEDIVINVNYDLISKKINLNSSSYSLNIDVSEDETNISYLDKEYLTKEEFKQVVSIISKSKVIILSNNLEINLNEIKLNYDNHNYEISGKLIRNDKSYEAIISFKYDEMVFDIDLKMINDIFYIDLTYKEKTYYITLNEKQFAKIFIDMYEGRGGLLKEENLNKLEKDYIQKYKDIYSKLKKGDYSSLTNKFDLLDTLNKAYDALNYLKNSKLSILDNTIYYSDLNNEVNISLTEDILNINYSLKEFNIISSGKISLLENVNDIKVNEELVYVNVDRLVNKLELVSDALINSSLTIEDLIDEGKLLSKYNAYKLDLSYSYKDSYFVNVNAAVNKKLDSYARIEIKHNEDIINIDLYYINGDIYFIYGDINIKLDKTDEKDGIKLILKYVSNDKLVDSKISTSEDYQKIVDLICDTLTSITIDSNNNLVINVALNKLLKGLEPTSIIVSYDSINGNIDINIPYYKGYGHIEEFNGEFSAPNKTYLNREDLDFLLKSIDDITEYVLTNKKYELNISSLDITYKESHYLINGYIYQNKEDIDAYFNIVGDKTYIIRLYRYNKIYYLDLKLGDKDNIYLKSNEESILKFIQTIRDNKETLLGEDKTLGDYYDKYVASKVGVTRKSLSFDEIIDLSFKALLIVGKGNLISNENEVKIVHEKLNAILTKDESKYLLDININDLEGLTLSGNISISNSEHLIVVPPHDYFVLNKSILTLDNFLVSLIEGGWNLDDALSLISEVIDYEGYKIDIVNIDQAGFKLKGQILIDKNMDISLYLKIKYEENETDFNIYYVGDDFYLTWNSYYLYLQHDEIMSTVETIMAFAGMKKMSLQEVYEAIDRVNEIYVSATGTKGENIKVSLALSKIYSELTDTTVVCSYDSYFKFTSLEDNLDLTISEFKGESNKPTFDMSKAYTGKDFDVLLDYARGFKEYLDEGALSLSFDDPNKNVYPLTISLGEGKKDLKVNGSVNLKMEDYVDGHASKITFSAKLYLDGYMHYHFAVDYTKDEILYLTFSTSWNKDGSLNSQTTVSFTRSQVVKLLKEILTGIDENSEIGKRLSKNDLNNINMVKKLLVDTGIIDKQDITIGKIDNTLKGIVPTVFKVLDFIKDATIRPNVDNRTIHIEKDYDYVSKKTGEVTTYSTNIDLKEDKTSSTNTDYIFDIKKLLINNKITINGIIKVKRYEGTIYVNKSKAISLNGMENLAVAFFNSVEEMNFNITGTAGMGIGKLELAGIDVDCRVAYVNGIIRGYIHLKVPAVLLVTKTPATASEINSYIYIDDKDIYMYKDVKYTDWFKTKHDYSYRKNTYKGFMKNIADNMIFLLNFTDTIANQITNSGDEIKLVPDKFLTSYSYKNDSYNMVLDLKNGLSNNMFSDLSMSIKTGNYNSKSYLRSFSGSTKLFSILSMTFDFKENGCFGSKPNMNVINTYFDNLSKFSYYKE